MKDYIADFIEILDSYSSEKLNSLLISYKESNNELLREDILLHNMRLILYVIHKEFNNTNLDINDLFQAGMIGLINALDKYDCSFNNSFSRYAIISIRNQIITLLSSEKKNNVLVSYEYIIDDPDDKLLFSYFERYFSSEVNLECDYEKKEMLEYLKKSILKLSDKEKNMIYKYYYEAKNIVAISKELGCSRQNVSQTLITAKRKLKCIMNGYIY